MKSKYVMATIILSISMLGMPVSAAAGTGGMEGELEYNLPEDKIIRNEKGEIVGIDVTDVPAEVEYTIINFKQLIESKQFKEYEKLGLTYDEDEKKLYFAGMQVQSLEDEYKMGSALQYFSEAWSETSSNMIDLIAVRDEDYHLKYFKFYRYPEYDDMIFEDGSIYDDFGEEEWEEDWTEGEAVEDEETEETSASIAVIGGADGPTSIFFAGKLSN